MTMSHESKWTRTVLLSALLTGFGFSVCYLVLDFQLLAALLIAMGLFLGLILVFKPERKNVAGIDITDMANNDGIADMLKDGITSLDTIWRHADRIRDPMTKTKLLHIHQLGQDIMAQVRKNPTQIKAIKRFFSYYLGVVLMVLDKYETLVQPDRQVQNSAGGIEPAEAELGSKFGNAFDLIESAFEKQLGKVNQKDILDLDVEMKVLESLLKEEGNS